MTATLQVAGTRQFYKNRIFFHLGYSFFYSNLFYFFFHEETGFESYPPDLDGVRQFIHLACAGIGSPLNVMVANVIIRQRRLRNPRNTFWLGVIFWYATKMIMIIKN